MLTPAAAFLGISRLDPGVGSRRRQDARPGGDREGQEGRRPDRRDRRGQKTNLDNEKAAGWITADQETAILARYTDAVTELVNNGPPVPAAGKSGGLLQTAATFLGMSVSDLQTALKSGKSLADVAKAKGKTVDDLVTALLAPAKKNLDQAVNDNKITPAQENDDPGPHDDGLTNLVNNTKPTGAQMSATQMSIVKYATLKAFAKRH